MWPTSPQMTNFNPYLIQACYAWVNDNGMRPHILVDAHYPGVDVPPFVVKEGRVVLNLSPSAVGHFYMGNDDIRFHTRFSGKSYPLVIPMGAIRAIYAEETKVGMEFSAPTVDPSPEPPATPPPAEPTRPRANHLRVVK